MPLSNLHSINIKVKRPKLSIWLLILLMEQACVSAQQLSLHKITDQLVSPVALAAPLDGSERLFICEQYGVIRLLQHGRLQAQAFLDIRDKIIPQSSGYSERGLLGLAFHPRFRENGLFYVYYSAPPREAQYDHCSVLAEYQLKNPAARQAEVKAERIIMYIDQPESNHNGGQLAFGPDGYLYLGLGDGGGAGDEHGSTGNGQNLESLLGKIIRIDVNCSQAYCIPPDNPFVNRPGRDEIWAYGLRNPWKFSFDRESHLLFAADVGQNNYEEINIIQKGGNYGWRIMEASHCFNPEEQCNKKGLEYPIDEYSHQEGICVIGGYVYRGKSKGMQGAYVFADWSGKLFCLKQNPSKTWKREELPLSELDGKTYINSLGEDEAGELYLLALRGLGPDKPKGILYQVRF